MKKYILLVYSLFGAVPAIYAQVNDNAVEQLLSKRVWSFNEVRLNMINLVPRLHRERKEDTLKAVISYYEKNYNTISTILYYEMICSIRDRTFKEELRNLKQVDPGERLKLTDAQFYEENIMAYLYWYKEDCRVSKGNYSEFVKTAYGDYCSFLQSFASEQMSIKGLSAVELWLLKYFAHPSDSLYSLLSRPEFNGSLLQKAWREYDRKMNSVSGLNYGIAAGVWIPQGKLAVVGSHPSLGFVVGGRMGKVTIDGNCSFKFLRSPNDYVVVANGNLLTTNYFFGGYIGLDGGYELWRRKRNEFDALCGVAWDGFDALPGTNNSTNNNTGDYTKSINSVNLNVGIGYRWYTRDLSAQRSPRTYLALQAKYNIVRYDNAGGTNLSGNTFTINIIYGSYGRRRVSYDIVSDRPVYNRNK